ncbi:MAG: tRNA uridine-5-carboxymethylaminomethyl(34) synthesis GTPase MnmE [Candidatus Obscuribacter sp.]|nr:tRNA uridine-5-carboxymethylaminomethyl(34) synthesis GTPase MnmE [Candidatus Obscuribacter sp.]
MLIDDTIAAISTPFGVGAIAIVRLSGPDAFLIAQKIFVARKKNSENNKSSENNFSSDKNWQPKSHQASIGYIQDPLTHQYLDEVVLIPYQGPNSYTGEDLVEINCHGSPIVTREILSILLKEGARLAQRGEFTKRGYLAGRLDLTQAEAVLDLIHSKTEKQSQLALTVLTGHLGDEIKAVRARLVELLTRIIAGIDFPEEVGELDLTDIEKVTSECLSRVNVLAKTARSGRFLREGLKLAIVGRPNAGKSSLLNRLLNFERAIVTDIPGTTRDSIEEPVDVNGIPVILIDTAGVRDTSDVVEQIGIERTTRSIKDADLTVILIDGTAPIGAEEAVLAEKLKAIGCPFFIVINKADLLNQKDGAKLVYTDLQTEQSTIKELANMPTNIQAGAKTLMISAKLNEGLEDFKRVIEKFAITDNSVQEVGGSLNERQGALCIRASESLEALLTAAQSGLPQDCLATDLKSAVDALDAINGHAVTEEVISEVFANFCIGK